MWQRACIDGCRHAGDSVWRATDARHRKGRLDRHVKVEWTFGGVPVRLAPRAIETPAGLFIDVIEMPVRPAIEAFEVPVRSAHRSP